MVTTFSHLLDRFSLELIRVLLAAAHEHLCRCHGLWLRYVYERLAGSRESQTDIAFCRFHGRLDNGHFYLPIGHFHEKLQ